MTLADALYLHRATLDIGIKTAARQAGVHSRTYHATELGTRVPSLPSFAKLCKWAAIDPRQHIAEFLPSRRNNIK